MYGNISHRNTCFQILQIQNQMQIILFNIKTFFFFKSVICLKNCSKMQSGRLLLKF